MFALWTEETWQYLEGIYVSVAKEKKLKGCSRGLDKWSLQINRPSSRIIWVQCRGLTNKVRNVCDKVYTAWNVFVKLWKFCTGWKAKQKYNLNRPRLRDFTKTIAEEECRRKMDTEVPEIKEQSWGIDFL